MEYDTIEFTNYADDATPYIYEQRRFFLLSPFVASKEEVLLGVRTDSDLTFKEHITSICSKVNQKSSCVNKSFQMHELTEAPNSHEVAFTSQFNYSPIARMFHSRSLNNKVIHIHQRYFRIVYRDFQSSFSALLEKDNSFTIHRRNIQLLATEIFKVKMKISPEIMNEMFDFSKNSAYELRCGNCLSIDQLSILRILGSSPLQILPLKYGIK